MDLKNKGTTWVGNIYQKFEAVCQEVDDFVSQDNVKYVESQVQTVGGSVKKFCSEVVQDLLSPTLMDPVNDRTQQVPRKQNDTIRTCTRSIGIEEKPLGIDMNQSSVEKDPIDHLTNRHASSSTECHPVKQYIVPPTRDLIGKDESDLSLGQDEDPLTRINPDMYVEENVMEEERSPSKELNCPEDEDSSDALLCSESIDENYKNGIMEKVSPATFACVDELRSLQKDGTICNSLSDEAECVSSASIASSENKVVETPLVSFSSSLLTESCNFSEFSNASSPEEVENMCHNPSIGCVSDLSRVFSSSESLPTLNDSKLVDTGLAFSSSVLSLQSNDTFRTDEPVCVPGSSGHKHEQCCECIPLEAFMSSEIGQADDFSIDIADPSLVTIDLSDEVKLEESCVIVDSRLPYDVSCRSRKLRSYKKILQDAFGSRKRLTKEYEQLAIWYDDIDTESTQHSEQNFLSGIPAASLESKNSQIHDLCDSEWELL